MQKRILGSQLTVSALGYGCMGLSHGYGAAIPKSEAIKCIHAALDCGYDFFDTAQVYVGQYPDGSQAVNEEIVGEALQPAREKVIIASKGGIIIDKNHQVVPNGSPEAFRRSLEESLRRLKVDTIDLYYQHRMDPAVEPETVAELMARFIREGKIRFWGISNGSEEYIRRANAVCKVTCVQLRYSMMARWNEKIFPLLEELDIGFVAFSPLANGFLSASANDKGFDKNLDYRSWMPQYTESGRAKAQKLIEFIRELAAAKKAAPAQISLAWLLARKPWIVPIPGSSKIDRIRENAQAVNLVLSSQELEKIDELLARQNFEVFGEQEKIML